jgi:hypothetical protein
MFPHKFIRLIDVTHTHMYMYCSGLDVGFLWGFCPPQPVLHFSGLVMSEHASLIRSLTLGMINVINLCKVFHPG